ncbi:MAG: hypothetical protein IJ009_01200 [Clostridia bacterium]|nr:hypothetical protein [Clostridia bacterium]
MKDHFNEKAPIRFLFPIDGDCINERDGVTDGNAVRVAVKVAAPTGHLIRIGEREAREENGIYTTDLEIADRHTVLSAVDLTAGTECRASVFRLPLSVGGYRISSDDNILFLADITAHRNEYTSIFDNPYLAVYKEAHDLYDAKVHLNLFYEFTGQAKSYFRTDRPDFDLSMMTDQFKDEFRENADWLKLSFHSRGNTMRPYENATKELITRECMQVHREILRFAGEESLSTCTTLHFGAANEAAVRAMRAVGYRVMAGYFIPGRPNPVAYHTSERLIEHIYKRDFFCDTDTDMFFGRIDSVLNCNTNEENLHEIAEAVASPTRGGYIEIMIHEQYFYEDYELYLSDFRARVLDPARYLYEWGYRGRFLSDVIRE